jgi:hypothetical protein
LQPLPKIEKDGQILGHDKNPASVFAHVDQDLHLLGSGAAKKAGKHRGQIGLIGRGPLRPKLVNKHGAAG